MPKKNGQLAVVGVQKSQKKRPVKAISKKPTNSKTKPKVNIAPSVVTKSDGPRRLQAPKRIWHKPLTWRNRPPVPAYKRLPKARKLFASTISLLRTNWKLFAGISIVFGLLNLLLVRGFSSGGDVSSLKSSLESLKSGFGGKLSASFVSFAYLLTTSGNGNSATSGVYQSIALVICSLAIIWALRQVTAGHIVRVRDSFYLGMYPLVPFLLIFLTIGLQLLPLALGGGLYSLVISNGIAVHLWEKALFIIIFAVSALWSLRMITGSVFALYIVTLPDMTPLKALRSAKSLVYGRRLLLWRKFIFLPFIMLLVAAVLEIPLILFWTAAAQWLAFILVTVAIAVVHGYLYNLYREML